MAEEFEFRSLMGVIEISVHAKKRSQLVIILADWGRGERATECDTYLRICEPCTDVSSSRHELGRRCRQI